MCCALSGEQAQVTETQGQQLCAQRHMTIRVLILNKFKCCLVVSRGGVFKDIFIPLMLLLRTTPF